MPTSRPRHVITETDDVARALADAAERWPEERGNPVRLLRRLVQEGQEAVRRSDERTARNRRAAVVKTKGVLAGAYGKGYLRKLRKDWPA